MSIFKKGTLDVPKEEASALTQATDKLKASLTTIHAAVSQFIPQSFPVHSPRRLEAELEKSIDLWLMQNKQTEFAAAVHNKAANMLVSLANQALAGLKVTEASGHNDGKMVELIQKTTGGHKGDSWCMDQQQSCVAYAERKLGLVSKLPCSASCIGTLNETPKEMLVDFINMQPGDIYIWEHGTSGMGHTENFYAWIVKNHSAAFFGGNTTAGYVGGKVIRDGGGSHQTQRAMGMIGDMIPKGAIRSF